MADPISYVADVYGGAWTSVRTGLPVDLQNGGTYALGSTSLNPPYSSLFWTNNSSSLNETGEVYFGAWLPGGQSSSNSTWVQIGVTVPITGSVQGNTLTSDLQGGYSGTGTTATVYSSLPPTDGVLPSPLLDLLTNPGRVHIQADITGGTQNNLVATLTIDPFAIPEPTAMSLLLVGIGAMTWIRRSRGRSSEKTG